MLGDALVLAYALTHVDRRSQCLLSHIGILCPFGSTAAAVAFAGLLVVIMRSDEVRGILTDLVRRALTVS
ncbi:DUF4244 domain-containing protein [Microbacterium alcoholitolerans]|uniref:DUF4244 domain-containing protein n=1 Tax=unclassified Microbacterium TaxID=2609290 RepID=UPI003D172EAC